MTFGSLFAGIGGLDLGLERAGMRCLWQVEIDPFCRKVLAKHWPDVPKYEDVCKVGRSDLEEVDLIAGGDPCQENSNARQGYGATSPSLGGEFIRIVDERRPRLVLRENPSATHPDAPWPFWRFRSELERLGYAVLPIRFRACCAGADHRRDRLFLFAELSDSMQTRLQGHVVGGVERAARIKGFCDAPEQNRWSAAPRVCRRIDGIPNRMDRLKSLGNAVVPQVAEYIGRMIIDAERVTCDKGK